VSQICALTVRLSMLRVRVWNSTPMVALESRLNSLRAKRASSCDLPHRGVADEHHLQDVVDPLPQLPVAPAPRHLLAPSSPRSSPISQMDAILLAFSLSRIHFSYPSRMPDLPRSIQLGSWHRERGFLDFYFLGSQGWRKGGAGGV